jgi:hypothetical protein
VQLGGLGTHWQLTLFSLSYPEGHGRQPPQHPGVEQGEHSHWQVASFHFCPLEQFWAKGQWQEQSRLLQTRGEAQVSLLQTQAQVWLSQTK